MDWIKRNLFFVVGAIVAFVLLGGAGWYLYSKIELNNQKSDSLTKDYEQLKQLITCFANLLKPMIETVDRHGLKKRFLQKHLKEYQPVEPPKETIGWQEVNNRASPSVLRVIHVSKTPAKVPAGFGQDDHGP